MTYTILGCNNIGSALVRNLSKLGEEILVIDNDETALAGLCGPKIHTIKADIRTFDFSLFPAGNVIAFVLLQENFEDNLALVKCLKKLFPDKFMVSRASDEKEVSELVKNGADRAIQTVRIITNAILEDLETAKLNRSVYCLKNIIKDAIHKGLAIFLQNNPDPDAIASGLALKRIADKYNVKARIYYGGHIGHQQNKTLVNLLETELVRLKSMDESLEIVNTVDKVALIEASIPSKNNVLLANVIPNIIIDHHQTDFSLVKGEFVEILPNIGATSTIMTRYLRHLDIVPDPPLATALRYGIRVDTGGFTRNTTAEDIDAAAYLSPLVDVGLLNQIENPPMSAETLDIIGKAIRNREVKDSYLISFAEFISDRDALPQAAELMLQMEGISTVLIFGIDKDRIQLSARSVDARVNLAVLLQKAFGFMNAGGHATMAAGCIDLGIFGDVSDKKSLLRITCDAVRKKFFSAAGLDIEKRETPGALDFVVHDSMRN